MSSMNDDTTFSSGAKEEDRSTQVDLADKQQKQTTVVRRLKQHLTSHVEVNILAETELLILTFCTGMQDATTFPDYHCFASNQTGNTVMLAMAIILPNLTGELFIPENIGVALGFFLAAGWITGQLGHIVGPRSRLWIVFCNLIQSMLVFMAAAIQYAYGIELKGAKTMVVIGLLAFAAGSQVVLSRALAITEISTAMATAAWVDLLIDPRLFAAKNRPRNRRVSFLAALVAGAFFGAGIYKGIGPATSVLFSAIGKLIVTLMFLLNKAEKAPEPRSNV
ncbi:uncharacterized protein Z520_07035 [Fonsecaea multimorphosa CBS 102226]|uniref:DUF1275 domain protein n=1 Tax=Fonsecaea multimorphosa CBS 102226 TaxID=1442371 RepID=A0A0D2IIW0_9EURO|nr:uncharacterized protein Z520_07035 [Fonsecaea multimorphosa CBS 102226]KIX96921.1 hypothetical protein Z520_07035 [Fonsecaea multimorphosa CBS 102226]OAL23119.1 hypothetical protein AYO22_06612 [Fonsecaea multimorphosa]